MWSDMSKMSILHDDVIKWKHFPRYWPFVRGIHRSSVNNSPHKGQWRGAVMLSLICSLNKWLSKQTWGWLFETPSCSLWRHCNGSKWSSYHRQPIYVHFYKLYFDPNFIKMLQRVQLTKSYHWFGECLGQNWRQDIVRTNDDQGNVLYLFIYSPLSSLSCSCSGGLMTRPSGPARPTGPVEPVAPCGPVKPVKPVAPVRPEAEPGGASLPGGPLGPGPPGKPWGPCR